MRTMPSKKDPKVALQNPNTKERNTMAPRQFLIGTIAALMLSITPVHAEEWKQLDSSITFYLPNHTEGPVEVEFYSQNRPGHTWGPFTVDTVPEQIRKGLTDTRQTMITISCKETEHVCLGGWNATPRSDGTSQIWGLGHNDHSCARCCFVCNGQIASSPLLRR
jgi:hypothetical protein